MKNINPEEVADSLLDNPDAANGSRFEEAAGDLYAKRIADYRAASLRQPDPEPALMGCASSTLMKLLQRVERSLDQLYDKNPNEVNSKAYKDGVQHYLNLTREFARLENLKLRVCDRLHGRRTPKIDPLIDDLFAGPLTIRNTKADTTTTASLNRSEPSSERGEVKD